MSYHKEGKHMSEEITEQQEQELPQEKIQTERQVKTKPLPEGYRKHFDDVIANMFSNPKYIDYNFYAHVLAQCKTHFDTSTVNLAGVSFSINHYKLWINPEQFNKTSLEEGLGIMKHEMLHILNNHCTIRNYKTENHEIWNIAYDCAINQSINRQHLTDYAIYPDTIKAPENKSGEQYYDFLKDTAKQQMNETCESCGGSGHSHEDCDECGGSGEDADGNTCGKCNGTGKEICEDCNGTGRKLRPLDDHSKWEESEGNDELRKDITKGMIEKAMAKSRGNLPHDIELMLEMFTRKAQVNWQKELKNILGNKRANKTSTIVRPNRRQPDRMELKGTKKDRIFELVVMADVSGSVSNEELLTGLNEIHEICKKHNATLKLLQIDTEVHGIEEFSKKTKMINRKAMGGTIMEGGIEYLRDHKIHYDALILITDGYIEDISKWVHPPKKKMMFLVTNESQKIPGIEAYKKYRQFNLKV